MEIELSIFHDCSILINKFVDHGDPSFKTFCQQWREAKFQYIYGVQTTAIEVIQTTKAIMHFAKRIACPSEYGEHTDENKTEREVTRRIGGIYLMYATYFKQPTNQFVKVLMNSETWQGLTTFIQNLSLDVISDEVRYIFWHLYKEDAFRFTACDYDLGLENMADYDRLYDVFTGNKCIDVVRESLRKKLMIVKETVQVLPGLISLENQYNISKNTLLCAEKLEKTLPPTKIFHGIHDAIKSIHDILEDEDGIENMTTAENQSNMDNKRKELKRKAVKYTTMNDEESSEEEKLQEKQKKQLWSVRKMIGQQLPEEITADLINNSTDASNDRHDGDE